MKKLAVFVEGYTELKFVEKLIGQIFNNNQCAIHTCSLKGGNNIPITIIDDNPPSIVQSTANYYILIYNCNGDNKVASYIRDQRNSLINAGYYKIIGFLDLYPRDRIDEYRFRYGLYLRLPQLPIPTIFVLSIMEIEAWFLSETSHFVNIDPVITNALILARLGFDPGVEDMQLRNHPAADLNDVYNLGGKTYIKSNIGEIDRTINSLDFANYYIVLQNSIPPLNLLINEIETIFN